MTSQAIGAPIGTTNIVERSIRFTSPKPTSVAAPPYAHSASTAPAGAGDDDDDDDDDAMSTCPHARPVAPPIAIMAANTTTSTTGRAVDVLTIRRRSRERADLGRPQSTTRRSGADAGRARDATSRPMPR